MQRKPARQKMLDPTLPIYQVKISLQHTEPLIWRRVQIDDCSLHELHEIIQTTMGWEDIHMYAFVVEGEEFGNPKRGSQADYDSRFVRLSDVVDEGHTRFRYDYDFGDDWEHVIEVENTLPAEPSVRYPRCVMGEHPCPPEDCGGPWGYAELLVKISDPEHVEHEDALGWVGDDFDPEEFDLDAVNDELRRLRPWLGKRKGKHVFQAIFAKGDLVRVKAGGVHDEYPDIPLGGWVGKIRRIAWLTPIAYGIQWTKPTLDQAHPVFFKRCQRDETKPYKYWVDEGQLESANGETPVVIEQPTNIVTPPLSPDEPDDRIRMVFGLTTDDALPKANHQTQRQFFDYLKTNLSFPFSADQFRLSSNNQGEFVTIQVLDLADAPLDRKEGIMGLARRGKNLLQVPLAGLQFEKDNPNSQYIQEYTYWLWESQEEEEGPATESVEFPIGTVAYYGPDDKTTTKIVAGVIMEEGAEPILGRWVASDVMTDPSVQKEIASFFKRHGVSNVSTSAGNMGCPHEEGEDFPMGGDCPFCPWWRGEQGSGAKE